MMELRCRNLHNADIGKKIENNGRKAMSDLQGSENTTKRQGVTNNNNNERCGFQQLE